jgi:iron complex transport system substrate-binding protein
MRAFILALVLLLGAQPVAAREIVDMAGRTVSVPETIRRVYVAHDPPAIFLTALAPDLMVGFTFNRSKEANAFLPPSVRRLPTVGGSARVNPEALLAQGIDVAIVWNIRGQPDLFAEQLTGMGLPTVMVDASPFRQYPASFRFLGRLLHREERAERLARALEETSARLDAALGAIPPAERVRVYYADSPDGLKSQCAGAFRGETVELAGGLNVMACDIPDGMTASVTVNLERLLLLDPEVILARTRATARFIRQDPGWKRLRAVREGRVYAPPELPFSWLERPHSQFKMLAVQWLANRLYPDRYPFDFAQATRDFYKLFYDMELTDDDIAKLRS